MTDLPADSKDSKKILYSVGVLFFSIVLITVGFVTRLGLERVSHLLAGAFGSTGVSHVIDEYNTSSDVLAVFGESEQIDSEQVDSVGGEDILYSNIYIVNDSVTVVLPSSLIGNFYREDCQWTGACDADIPCVNVVEIREYVDLHLERLLDKDDVLAVAKNNNGRFSYRASDMAPDMDNMVDDIVEILSLRSEKYRELLCNDDDLPSQELLELAMADISSEIRVSGKEVPGTDGFFAPFYIEIDDSQQHLYVWKDGKILADYEVSGFYDEYAVYGVFKIYNKSFNAWSPVAEKWMPYWMAFHYDAWQEAWLGIHELVYWTGEDGQYYEESSDSIGQKKSGGCVRLDRGEAEELFDIVEVEMPVLIHP